MYRLFLLFIFQLLALGIPLRGQAQQFSVKEATIADIHAAIKSGLTCRAVVETYLQQIAANDKKGAPLNSILMTNPRALEIALLQLQDFPQLLSPPDLLPASLPRLWVFP